MSRMQSFLLTLTVYFLMSIMIFIIALATGANFFDGLKCSLLIPAPFVAIASLLGAIARSKAFEEFKEAVKLSVSVLYRSKIAKYTINSILGILIIASLTIFFWGTEDINKPFNKPEYEAWYYVNIYRNPTLKKSERAEALINVKNGIFKRKIFLKYIYYNNRDFEFDDENTALLVGKPVKYRLWTGEDYKEWYVELTTIKIEKY